MKMRVFDCIAAGMLLGTCIITVLAFWDFVLRFGYIKGAAEFTFDVFWMAAAGICGAILWVRLLRRLSE